jgi:hypothetical protein
MEGTRRRLFMCFGLFAARCVSAQAVYESKSGDSRSIPTVLCPVPSPSICRG